jgi:hypothetical protein
MELSLNVDTSFAKISVGTITSAFNLIGIDDNTDGREIVVSNETGFSMFIVHGSLTVSSAANAIMLPTGGGTYEVAAHGAVKLIYSDTTNSGVGAWQLL